MQDGNTAVQRCRLVGEMVPGEALVRGVCSDEYGTPEGWWVECPACGRALLVGDDGRIRGHRTPPTVTR